MIGVTSSAPRTDWIAQEAAIARRAGPFGIGLMAWMLQRRPELLDAALAERPVAVSISFGDPGPWVATAHAAGARVLSQVSDAPSAERALAAGVDAIVAQDTEAGGHTGAVGTLPLLQLVLELGEARGVPVLAAGGIVTGAGIAAVLAAGADGAWIGTRFMATPEALGSEAAKARLLGASERDTVHTRAYDVAQGIPWPPECPGRALRSAFTERWHGREEELGAQHEGEVDAVRADPVVYAGQGAGAVRECKAPPSCSSGSWPTPSAACGRRPARWTESRARNSGGSPRCERGGRRQTMRPCTPPLPRSARSTRTRSAPTSSA